MRRWLWISAGIALGLALWTVVIEPASLEIREYEIALPHWPADAGPLRVAVLADLHVGSLFNGLGKLEEIVERTNGARPDVILLAGDYVIQGVLGGNYVAPEDFAPVLGKLRARLGVWAVLGNHDWWLDAPTVRSALEANGIQVLDNEAAVIEAESGLWLAGVGDYWEGAPNVPRTLQAIPASEIVIVLTHNPDIFPEIPRSVALSVAGHTHGGQVNFPLIGRPILPSQFEERYAAGHIVEDGQHFFVSTGLGTSILPVRFRVPPEISILRIARE